ncbi:hypothetical protein CWI36_1415p0010 [Hamiltosporidium magnivora]|uniref:Integrase catalytic domain-containing protein n=1 Tax=Hamiltosporidium magnivora TaxID=148818 RepID=A0A4Q9L1E5_9MICR|nr:hypothetical protein CWI36_1415p0010 [Hamiltosporidium magnivora]
MNDKAKSNFVATKEHILGNEITVEMNESKFGKRKYNRIVSCKNRQEKEILIAYLTTGHYPAEYSKEERGASIYKPYTKKYDLFMMDCVDLRRDSDQNDQYSWILDVIDTYTKHLWSFKLINKTAELVRDSLEFLFDNFGVLGAIHSNKTKGARPSGTCKSNHKKIASKKIVRNSATNKSPFMLFFGQPGFNNPLFGSVIVQNEVSTMVPAIDIDPGIVLVEENAADTQWNLEIASDIHEEFTPTVTTTTIIIDDDLGCDNNICSDVAKLLKNYRERL